MELGSRIGAGVWRYPVLERCGIRRKQRDDQDAKGDGGGVRDSDQASEGAEPQALG